MKKDSKEGKARIRVFFAEIEGDNETVQDALRSVGAAVSKTFQQENTIVRVISAGSEINPKELVAATEQDSLEADLVEDEEPNEGARARKPSSRTQARPKKAPTYTFIKNLNFRPVEKKSLKDFFAEKKPADQQQALTVILYYLQHTLEVESVTIDHIYSGLKEVVERVPRDISQSLYNISKRKNYIDSGDSSCLKMTTTGDNFVEHDLPFAPKREAKEK